MNHKFEIDKVKGVWITNEAVAARKRRVLNGVPDGEYEMILRKKIRWDVKQMRNYFHGPVRDFILAELRKEPFITTKTRLKEDLKTMYGPETERMSIGGLIREPKSTSEYTFDEYTSFLNRINEWCIERLGRELPTAEEVE